MTKKLLDILSAPKALLWGWNLFLIFSGICLLWLTFRGGEGLPLGGIWRFAAIAGIAFLAEYIDSALGMGYGTTLTPILIIFGYKAIEAVVPAILVSEFVTGISAGFFHHRVGNVDLRRGTRAYTSTWILSICSVLGGCGSVLLALKLSKNVVSWYIGLMVISIGLFILLAKRYMGRFSWGKIIGLGTVAAFNKGISGGGYGPLLTGGQVLIGVPEKNAIAVTSLAEGVMCLAGIITYGLFQKGTFAWSLIFPLVTGAILSVPLAAWTVKILPEQNMRKTIGYATVFLGALLIVKLYVGA
ncbi:MAG: sulfite exporter TauE/SafE family protein [Planctomycetota bacterium]